MSVPMRYKNKICSYKHDSICIDERAHHADTKIRYAHKHASICIYERAHHREQRSRVYLVKQDKHRLTLLIVIYFIVESQCVH